MIAAVCWAGLAAGLAVGLEFQFRSGMDWWRNAWWIIPVGAGVNFAIYRLLSTEMGWLPSIVLFGGMTATLRIILSLAVLRDPLHIANVVAAGVLRVGVGVRVIWR